MVAKSIGRKVRYLAGYTNACVEHPRPSFHRHRRQSASQDEAITVQYFLARTLESVGEVEEASTLYQHIVRIRPNFEAVASRMKQLTVPPKPLTNWTRSAGTNGSWFSHALDSLHQLIGSRR